MPSRCWALPSSSRASFLSVALGSLAWRTLFAHCESFFSDQQQVKQVERHHRQPKQVPHVADQPNHTRRGTASSTSTPKPSSIL